MQLAGRHVFRCLIGRFVASIFLLGIGVGGAADEVVCCSIDSELAIVKYESSLKPGWAWVDIELPQAVDRTEPAQVDELHDDGSGESSCEQARYEPAPQWTRRSEAFGFIGADLRVEAEGGDSGRLDLFLPIRMSDNHYIVDDTGKVYFGGWSGKVHTRFHLANHQGSTISFNATYLLDGPLGSCVSTLEFEIQPPAADAEQRDHDGELPLQRTSPRS